MQFILMAMDGAGWHRANALTVPKNMALIFLPPYSPELNPVEHIWDSIRENSFRNKVFNSIGGECSEQISQIITYDMALSVPHHPGSQISLPSAGNMQVICQFACLLMLMSEIIIQKNINYSGSDGG